jgi:flagellin-like protein
MKFRKLRKNVKAVSPVLSVLMMIAVAVAASLVTYAWVMGYLSFTTDKVGKAIQIQSIGDVSDEITVYVQNVGDSAVTLVDGECVYINGAMQTSATLEGATSGQLTLEKGDTATITTGFSPIDINTPYAVKVVTEDGTFTEASKTFG